VGQEPAEGGVTVSGLCRKVGMSRQNFYARRQQRKRRQVDGDLVAALVQQERRWHPRMGTRKLYHKLKPELEAAQVRVGRDRMFEELGQRGLLVPPLPASYPRTTQSYHNLPVFRNLIQDRVVDAPNQVWVSDLSYVRTREGFVYLALITDKYSRKIVGSHAGDTLEAAGCLEALEQALGPLPPGAQLTHHSDRGCQYCSHQYVNRLQESGIAVSMTESHHCAENALAERMNGILKQEYGLGGELPSKAAAGQAVGQAVWLYNTQRPHGALDYQVPEQVHRQGGVGWNRSTTR